MSASTKVPPSFARREIRNFPPNWKMRSRMPTRPYDPDFSIGPAGIPMPSSLIRSVSASPYRFNTTATFDACAYFATLVSDSCTTR